MTPVDREARELISHGGLGQTLFVEAGAGTGKTRHLVERVVSLVIEEGVPLREIAAITFTEAAAAELSERIREAIERAPQERSGELVAERAQQALIDADVAAITTLHGFALRILSEHPVAAALPPEVDVLDEVSSLLGFEERWERFTDRLYTDPSLSEAVVRLALCGVPVSSDRRACLRDVASLFNQHWDRLDLVAGDDLELPPLDLAPVQQALLDVLSLPRECKTPDECTLVAFIEKIRPEIERILVAGDDARRVLTLLRSHKAWKPGNKGKPTDWPDRDAARQVIRDADAVLGELVRTAADSALRVLAVALARFTLAEADRRRGEGRLEYHDLLVLALGLVRDHPDVRRDLHERYTHLLLDEFQDTDPIQAELALLIAAGVDGRIDRALDDDTVQPEPGRLFFVGDPKQSIYRFRRADIELFLRCRQRFVDDRPTELVQNFRTVPPILHWVNDLFTVAMAAGEPGRQPEYQRLHPDREGAPGVDQRPVVFGTPHPEADADGLRTEESVDVARALRHIRDHPDRWPVQDTRTGEWRPARLDDVAILIPTRASLRFLERALADAEVPYRVDTGSLVYDTQEARDLLATLRAVADPTDALALVAALRSPLFSCGDDDLARWALAGGRWDVRAAPPPGIDGDHPVATGLVWLRQLHDERWWRGPADLLQRIASSRHVYELAFTERRPRDVWRRVRFLVDQARAFEASQGADVRAYLEWAELQRREGTRSHQPLLGEVDDRAARILTVHGAKGLEFPIVVCAGLTTQRSSGRKGVQVIWGSDGRPQVRMRKDVRTENFEELADLEAEMDEDEKVRLLYVALTRARDHLLVGAHHKPDKGSFAEQIWEHAQGGMGSSCRSLDDALTGEPGAAAPPVEARAGEGDGDYLAERATWMAERESWLASQRVPRVTSATAVAGEVAEAQAEAVAEEDGETEGFRPPWRRGRAGTAVGQAVHSVLQEADLEVGTDLEALAASAAAAEGMPDISGDVAALARSALASGAVRRAMTAGRHWRELYVAAPVGGITLEGYVDLLVEEADGLVVVDYKTDSVANEAEVDAKLDRYRIQAAAYALALETSTGEPVKECCFVFCKTSGPIERTVDDLDAAKDEVRALLTSFSM